MDKEVRNEEHSELDPPLDAPFSYKKELWEWAKAAIIAVFIVLILRWVIVSPYVVEGQSMQPNFSTGERLIVSKVLYYFRTPKPGEVIVFHHPTEERDLIKRVVAGPGDRVKVEGDDVYVNGKKIAEPYLEEVVAEKKRQGSTYNDFDSAEIKVPPGKVYVLGDNRSDSTDSRILGPIDIKRIVGRTEFVFWPLHNMHIIGDKYKK